MTNMSTELEKVVSILLYVSKAMATYVSGSTVWLPMLFVAPESWLSVRCTRLYIQ